MLPIDTIAMDVFQQHQFPATITRHRAGQRQWTRFHGGVLTALNQRIDGRITPLKLVAYYGENVELVHVFIVNEHTSFGRLGDDIYIDTPLFHPHNNFFKFKHEHAAFAISMASRNDADDFETWLVSSTRGVNRFLDGKNCEKLLNFAFRHRDNLSRFPPEANEVALIPTGTIDRHLVFDEPSARFFMRANAMFPQRFQKREPIDKNRNGANND